MKKVELIYKDNREYEDIKANLMAEGYHKTSDCYWAQIFENADGDMVITERL